MMMMMMASLDSPLKVMALRPRFIRTCVIVYIYRF